jgi:hypothetical protein
MIIIFGSETPTRAYILPAEQILTFVVDRLGSGRALMVRQKTVFYDPSLEQGMQERDETLYFAYPDRFRSEVDGPGVKQIKVVSTEGALSIFNGKIIGETENPFDHFKDLLLYREAELLANRLSQLGINLQTVSLGRFKGEIAYVIGAKYPDESAPQVWINKNTFRPVRLILEGDGGQEVPSREVEYTEHQSLSKNSFYPGRILFFEHGTLVRMHVMKVYEINPEIVDEIFDVAYLKRIYEPIVPTLPAPSPSSELDELKKSIQDFKKIFE